MSAPNSSDAVQFALVGISLPSFVTAAPMTYMHKGRQYVVVAVSGNGQPAELVAVEDMVTQAKFAGATGPVHGAVRARSHH